VNILTPNECEGWSKSLTSTYSHSLKQLAKKVLPKGAQQALRQATSLVARAKQYSYRKLVADKYLQRIQRGNVDLCWCGGELLPFEWHSSYGVCKECGSYVNRFPPIKEELERLYSFDLYWHIKQRADGLPTIEGRPRYDRADGRVDFWLNLISKYGPPRGQVIEVGCAHGVLLNELKHHGYDCIGVEIDEEVAAWTRKTMNLDVRAGFFPGIELPPCDLFLAVDVLEHSPDPEAFMRESARLLKSGGVAVIQSAVDRYDYVPPFRPRFKQAFDDIEHLFIFTDRALTELAKRSQLRIISLSERIWLMGEICIFAKNSERPAPSV
jgi:SAM-dependent methyltransferase